MYINSNRTSLAHKIKTPIYSVTQKETKLVPLSCAETTNQMHIGEKDGHCLKRRSD